MPKTREQFELTTVHCGVRSYSCATTAECEAHIQQLTRQIHNPGASTPAAISIWRQDRDAILDRLSWLIIKAEREPHQSSDPR